MFTRNFAERLPEQLEVARDRGYTYIKSALGAEFCHGWRQELIRGPWQRLEDRGQNVQQEFDFYRWQEHPTRLPLTGQVTRRLGKLIRNQHRLAAPYGTWRPNDISIQRYQEGQTGITAHRDYKSDITLVAVFTVAGYAKFRACSDQTGTDTRDFWYTEPGSLILLRGPGLLGPGTDGRVYHSIHPPKIGHRISVGIRHNIKLTGEA